MTEYIVAFTRQPLVTLDSWETNNHIPSLMVDHFRSEGSDHRPGTRLRLAHDNTVLYGLFEVHDRYVRCVHTAFQSPTHNDSCVELFLQPDPNGGYFNFEWNCCGALAAFYITDPTRTPNGFAAYTPLQSSDASRIRTCTTLHGLIEPEITTPIVWQLSFAIELSMLQSYTRLPASLIGQTWRANVYKCADGTSHPHWAAWSPVPALNFHLPGSFGRFQFL